MINTKTDFRYRRGTTDDLTALILLAVKSWGQYQPSLTPENWAKLYHGLSDRNTYTELLDKADCLICATDNDRIIGMAFLVPNGNPTEIYDKDWCYIRFLTVDLDFGGQGIGQQLTIWCIETARNNGEKTIALHTSELMDKARHIYESLGFKVLREIDRRFGKRYWLYGLDLTQPAIR